MRSETLTNLLHQLDGKRLELGRRRPLSPAEAARLRLYLDVEWTYHSNAIEGSTLTRQETLVVLKHGLTVGGRSLVEHLEAINHQHAIEYVETLATRSTPITEDDVKAIHRLVLRTIDDDHAGVYRPHQVFIAGSAYTPPPAQTVPDRMMELSAWLASTDDATNSLGRDALHPVERAAHSWRLAPTNEAWQAWKSATATARSKTDYGKTS